MAHGLTIVTIIRHPILGCQKGGICTCQTDAVSQSFKGLRGVFRNLKINRVISSKSLTIYIIVINNYTFNRAKTFEGRKKTRFQEFLRFTPDRCEINLKQNVFRRVDWKSKENMVANNNRHVDCFQTVCCRSQSQFNHIPWTPLVMCKPKLTLDGNKSRKFE